MTNTHADTAWPAEAVATLQRMWPDSPWYLIADQLYKDHALILSRSAICGKAHRLKLASKKTGPVTEKPKSRKVRAVQTTPRSGQPSTNRVRPVTTTAPKYEPSTASRPSLCQDGTGTGQVGQAVQPSSNSQAQVGQGSNSVRTVGAMGGIVGRKCELVVLDDLGSQCQPAKPRKFIDKTAWTMPGPAAPPSDKLDVADYECGTSVSFLREAANKRECKWPTNNDIMDMTVCGQPATCGAYCAKHGALAYQPNAMPTAKRNRRIHAAQEFDY